MMLIQIRSSTRSTPRHRVDVPCEIITGSCDAPSLSWATDMSADGVWLDDRDDLQIGEDLVVCFKPGVFWRAHELMVFANVARVSPGLRDDDVAPGIGLEFVDLTQGEKWALRSWLRPRPAKTPSRRRRGRTPASAAPARASFAPAPFAPASPFARRID